MNAAVTVFRDITGNAYDFEHWQLLVNALGRAGLDVEPKVFDIQFADEAELFTFIRAHSLDRPVDLHLVAQSYPIICPTIYPWTKAGKVWVYNQQDEVAFVPYPTVQVLRHHATPQATTILAPYGPWPIVRRLSPPVAPTQDGRDIDVLWCGATNVSLCHPNERFDWLAEFESVLATPAYQHIRYMRTGDAGPTRLFPQQYVEITRRARICLSLRGNAHTCFRTFEGMHFGCCLVAQHIKREEIWHGPIPGVNWIETPREAADACLALLESDQWAKSAALSSQWYQAHYGNESLERWGDETVAQMLSGV